MSATGRRTQRVLAGVVHLLACVLAATASATAQPEDDAGGDGDPSRFAAVVEHLAAGARAPLRVDPRAARAGADLRRLEGDDLAGADAEGTAARAAVLDRLGIPATDALADDRCTFTVGAVDEARLRTLADSARERVVACRSREPYTSAVVGTPRRDGAEPGAWQVDARVMTPGGFRVWEMELRREPGGRWRVVEARDRGSVWS